VLNDWVYEFYAFQLELGPVPNFELNLSTTTLPAAFAVPFWQTQGPFSPLNFELAAFLVDAWGVLGPLPSWATLDAESLSFIIDESNEDGVPNQGVYDFQVQVTEPSKLPGFKRADSFQVSITGTNDNPTPT